ncbi:efflux transporter outer membrane subunit [Zestomonas carbonaria]|uniref:Cation efflux system protein CusC n=1 Tax=Zestomonas carbonaria TaxID=2762745 RepID=A0A7U7I8H7_9GAMM|nr:efflux transporter outer membrane subunit [Pseudomonas carbonaria]CAD5106716.1 Cation efflux system protein CusC [Pseudomonas carbonaria]
MAMKPALPLLLLLALAACSRHQPAPDELPETPAQWRHANALPAQEIDSTWWRAFGSDELDRLVAQSFAQSPDLAAAVARVRQAEASARLAGAPLLPRLDGNLGASRAGRLGGDADTAGNRYEGGLAASYEVDLWGRLRAGRDSAELALRASRFDRDALHVTLGAGVANTWLQTVGLGERRRIAELNLANAERVLATVEARWRAGAAIALELAQQRGVVATQRRLLADLGQQLEDSRTALALLLGASVTELRMHAADLDALRVPSLGAGLPSELLGRRPDLARAEANLAAADADVEAARAALLPRLDLTARAGGGSGSLSRVFADPVYSLAAALAAPIFDGGRLAADRDIAIARREELLADYRGAIVTAFADVETALNALAGSAAKLAAQREALAQAELAFRLAESRYRAGAETLLTLLDAQRTLYAAQDEAAQLQLERLQASVGLYRALGGGWRAEQWLGRQEVEELPVRQ